MAIILATTWYPRGELPRFSTSLPVLMSRYCGVVVSYIAGVDPQVKDAFTAGELSLVPNLFFYENHNQAQGRYMALNLSLNTSADFIHYADMDRLLRWVETRPGEWSQMVGEVEKHDCIIFGRTDRAMLTHPQALIFTEKLSNQVVSHFLGAEMDVSAGSKSFSRLAAKYLVDHSHPANSIGTDAEWPILLNQAGFELKYVQVDGLDWETADHHQPHAASADEQKRAAMEYDADPQHWLRRVEIAGQIIQSALELNKEE